MPKFYADKPIPEPFLTTGDIARYCHTTFTQVKRWIQMGELKAIQTTGGHCRIDKEDFRSFLEHMGIPVIEEFFRPICKKKVLVADDDKKLVQIISKIIKEKFKELIVEVAYDGYETLIAAGDFKPDLIILDIRMPGKDGLEICRRIRQNKTFSSEIKILAMTAHSEAYDREMVIAGGADEYLLKPFKMKMLIDYVEKLI